MRLIYGDLFDSKEMYLCHQCNCKTKRAAHLAAAVFEKYPYADIYHERAVRDDPELSKPGNIIIRGDPKNDKRYVLAMLAQVWPGKPKFPKSTRDGFDARKELFQVCLDKMRLLHPDASFAFPWGIGCGAAGGKWGQYQDMLINFEKQSGCPVVVYKLES